MDKLTSEQLADVVESREHRGVAFRLLEVRILCNELVVTTGIRNRTAKEASDSQRRGKGHVTTVGLVEHDWRSVNGRDSLVASVLEPEDAFTQLALNGI
jgi:hypothetical protein